MNLAIKESPSSETIYSYSSEVIIEERTENKLNGSQIYVSGKEYWLRLFQS